MHLDSEMHILTSVNLKSVKIPQPCNHNKKMQQFQVLRWRRPGLRYKPTAEILESSVAVMTYNAQFMVFLCIVLFSYQDQRPASYSSISPSVLAKEYSRVISTFPPASSSQFSATATTFYIHSP